MSSISPYLLKSVHIDKKTWVIEILVYIWKDTFNTAWSLDPSGAPIYMSSTIPSPLVMTKSSNEGVLVPCPLVGPETCWYK